jgi:subtilase family serine protease
MFDVVAESDLLGQPETEGVYTLCAMIDPDDEVQETNEDNNVICRTFSVLPTDDETVPHAQIRHP